MQGADALGNGRKVKTAGTTASGTLNAPSTGTQGVVSDVLKTPVAAVEGAGDVGAPVEVKAAQGGIENATTAINTNPAQHTPTEQAVIDEYQAATDKNLVEFFDEARQK